MRPLRGIIFDFDGTIFDTETPEYESWRIVCAEYGVPLPIPIWAAGVGVGVAENPFSPSAYLEKHAQRPVNIDAVRRDRRLLFARLLESQQARPGIPELIGEAKQRGLKIGLASSSGHSWVENYLERLGLLSSFPVRLCAEDVAHTKPNPELYARCVEALGIDADEAIALEDSPNGVTAAKAAGLFCACLPNPLTSQLSGLERADVILTSPASLSLDGLIAVRDAPPVR